MVAPPPAPNSSSAIARTIWASGRRDRDPAPCRSRERALDHRGGEALAGGAVVRDPLAALRAPRARATRRSRRAGRRSRRSRAPRGRTAAGRPGSRGPSPSNLPGTTFAEFFMSTSTWKNAVVGIQRIALRHTASVGCPGAPSHSGAWIASSGPNSATPSSWCVIITYRMRARARRSSACHSPMLLNTRTTPAVDVAAAVEEHLLLPLAEVRGADPDRVVDAGVDEPLGAAVDERVLARPGAEALAEEHELRSSALGNRGEPRVHRVEQEPRLLADLRGPGRATAPTGAPRTASPRSRSPHGRAARARSPRRSSRSRCPSGTRPAATSARTRRSARARRARARPAPSSVSAHWRDPT